MAEFSDVHRRPPPIGSSLVWKQRYRGVFMPRRSSPRIRTLRALTGAAVVAAAITAVAPVAAQASVACNETALVQAIDDANAAGGGNVVLEPLCTYDLATSHATGANGADGLPIITTVITLTGDQNVITRSSALGTPAFRIAEVASTGKLTLKLVTLSTEARWAPAAPS
jgi:hypothetical protein